jgi:hypothetical protein
MNAAEIWKIVKFIVENLIWLRPLIERKSMKGTQVLAMQTDLIKIYGSEIENIAQMLQHLSENDLMEILNRAKMQIDVDKISLSEFLTLQAVKKLLKLP